MRRQIAFDYNDKRYVTIFGCGDYLNTVAQPSPGIAELMSIMLKSGFSSSFNKEFGMSIRNVDSLISANVVVMEDQTWNITGNYKDSTGNLHSVQITKNGLMIDGKLEGAEEKKPEPAPVKVEEKKVEPAPVKEEKKPEPVKTAEEKKPEPEPVKEEKKEDADQETSGERGHVRKVDMSIGFHMGTASPSEQHLFGVTKPEKSGFYIGVRKRAAVPTAKPQPYTPSYIKAAVTESADHITPEPVAPKPTMQIDPEIANAPETPTPIPNEVLQNLADRWSPNREPAAPEHAMEPAKDDSPQKAIKDRLRSHFSPEVNAVIGDIPHQLLGDIREFTLNAINYDEIKEQGVTYCIDKRWRKCGNWFCIDIVDTRKRAFYNSKKKLIVEISVDDCKAWLKAVS